jgi:uncharacterized protein (TIGR03435 family)
VKSNGWRRSFGKRKEANDMERLLLEFSVRTALIAAATGAALWVLRIRTAAARHAAWIGVMLAMLLMPAWIGWGPKASLPVLPVATNSTGVCLASSSATGEIACPTTQHQDFAIPVAQAFSLPRLLARDWGGIFEGLYLLGAGALLLRLAIGTILANRLTSASCVTPVTVGLLRPRIILPACWTEWTEALLDAVLTHEREHARRRDPLVHWLALFNRAVFWFHPLAWWLERRLSALAEEACDAAVLARGFDAAEYSGYLLDLARAVERAGRRVNVVAMAMPGSALPRRIRTIAQNPCQKISRTRLMCAALACAIPTVVFAAGRLDSIPPALTLPVFLAQVPAPPVQLPPAQANPPQIASKNISVHQLLVDAYGLMQPYLILGLSTMEENARYDIDATIPAGKPLQNLLAQRFNLRVHRETQNKPEYELVVAPGGLKMKETPGRVRPGGGFISLGGWAPFVAGPISVGTIAAACSNLVHRPVLNHTGLTGDYDVNPTFMLDAAADLFTALDQQLGLRLEPVNTPVDVLVVDHIDLVPGQVPAR